MRSNMHFVILIPLVNIWSSDPFKWFYS